MLAPFFVIVLIRYLIPKALTNYYLLSETEEQEVCFYIKKERDEAEEEEEVIIDDNDAAAAANYVCSRDMLATEIMERLGLSDQARFRAVCKTWFLASAAPQAPIIINNNNTLTKSLPWYVHCNRMFPTVSNILKFSIYDPSSSSWLSDVIISLSKLGIPTPPLYYCDIGITCHKNWFIVSITKSRSFVQTRRFYFIYSYITKKLIKLPTFSFRPGFYFIRTFTTHPDSPTCLFVLLNAPINDRFVVVTCRKGDRKWIAREFPNTGHDAFRHCDCTPIFFGGMLYIVSPYGQLAFYNILDREFSFVSLGIDQLFALNYMSLRRYEIFELHGELMILYFGSRIKNKHTFPGNPCIKRFDWSNKVWIHVSSLGGNTLFVADRIYSVAVINREQMRCNGILSNKIYHFFDDRCAIYSLGHGNLVKFMSINLLEGEGGDLISYKDNNGTAMGGNVHWYLQPPVIVY